MARDALEAHGRKVRNGGKATVRQARCKLTLPSVTVAGGDMDISQLIELLEAALEAARKANKEALDIRTFERVLKGKAKGGSRGA